MVNEANRFGGTGPLPAEAKVVIVGGGVIGTSVAYHLTKLGWKDIVLLEQAQLGGGTSWHAAGLVGRLRTSNSMTKINKYTVELYSQLQQETGHSIGWKQVGSLIVARSDDSTPPHDGNGGIVRGGSAFNQSASCRREMAAAAR